MRAAVLQAYNEPMVIEEITLADSAHERAGSTSAGGRVPLRPTRLQGKVPMGTPLILGHEGTGTVLAVGPRSAREARDRVIASFVPACGQCFFASRPVAAL